LCEASPEAKLEASHSLAELKVLARKLKLKVSGRKDELAARLVDSGDPELLEQIGKVRFGLVLVNRERLLKRTVKRKRPPYIKHALLHWNY
jgi:hypothetical protein